MILATACVHVYYRMHIINTLTSVFRLQVIFGGGSGAYLTRHVRFIVLPLLTKRSGAPTIIVSGSGKKKSDVKYSHFNKDKHCVRESYQL